MRPRHVIPLLAVAAAVPSLAFAGARSTMETIGHVTGLKLVDVDRSGKPSVGDFEIATVALLDPASGATVGHSVVQCTVLDGAGTQFLCFGYNQFRGGELMLAGHFSGLSRTYRLAIVGGTGEYAGARGWENGTWLDAKFTKLRIVDTFRA